MSKPKFKVGDVVITSYVNNQHINIIKSNDMNYIFKCLLCIGTNIKCPPDRIWVKDFNSFEQISKLISTEELNTLKAQYL